MSSENENIVLGHATLPESRNDCDCCEGVAVRTPPGLHNRPGLSAIAYRVGTHARFKQTMLARLSSAEHPALDRLRTRDDDDFSIALIDAWATVADVLTFYQERIANESYLATATERLSIAELARLIGYRLRPGVAAETHLAFTLEERPRTLGGVVPRTKIPSGTQVQSIPGPEERAQTFETVEDIVPRPEWNAMGPRQSRLIKPNQEHDEVTYIKGVTNNLQPGDAILLVGPERANTPGNENWDFRRLTKVETDVDVDTTRIEWRPGLGSVVPRMKPSADPDIYVFRMRTSLFGYSAPHRALLPNETETNDWSFTITGKTIDLDNVYPSIAEKSWIVLSQPQYQELYRAERVTEGGLAKYAVSGRTTRIQLHGENLHRFDGSDYRETAVFAQSEKLELAETPITTPVWNDSVVLDRLVDGLEPGHRLIVRGKRVKLMVLAKKLTLNSDTNPSKTRSVKKGEVLTLLASPADIPGSHTKQWRVRTAGGFEGSVTTTALSFKFVAADKDEPDVAEAAIVKEKPEPKDELYSELLISPLAFAYDRASTRVLANVARATHGQTVGEILGSGNASRPHQSFMLKQAPTTYVGADNALGAESTLEVRVDDVLWQETPSLFGRGPRERVYTTRLEDSGETILQFGDGVNGARIPSGQDNVDARYRKGTGLDGLVEPDTLQTLLTQPLGVRGVTNPLPSSGADDPEQRDDARENAPLTVLTLDRTVSLQDYEDFARSFSGIAKALATWSWDGESRRVHITVAGPNGAPIPSNRTRERLLKALKGAGDPFVKVVVQSYRPASFRIKLKVTRDPNAREETVSAAVEEALRSEFGFRARSFGHPVALSQVIATAQGVAGVVAVDVDRLYRTTPPNATPIVHPLLLSALPELDRQGQMSPAELLTLAEGPLEGLTVLQ